MRREFCCGSCGLVWFGEDGALRPDSCPECGKVIGIYACDGMGFAYAVDGIKDRLKEHGKEIHYAQDHPYYGRKEK